MRTNNKVFLLACCMFVSTAYAVRYNIFIYSPGAHDGLHLAFLKDKQWREVGQLCSSDYSKWGSEKRMFYPDVVQSKDGSWRAVWQVNDNAPCFAAAYSDDLILWRPQDYPRMSVTGCIRPYIFQRDSSFDVMFSTPDGLLRRTTASFDFRHFSKDVAVLEESYHPNRTDTIILGDKQQIGHIFSLPEQQMDRIINYFASVKKENEKNSEVMTEDSLKLLPLLKTNSVDGHRCAEATVTIDNSTQKKISDHLIGVFFEDINYAADGGLYAEMVQNRDFEYDSSDHKGWTASTAWHSTIPLNITDKEPLSMNNPHYVVFGKDSISNEGWDGMVIKQGEQYHFCFYVRNIDRFKNFTISLVSDHNKILASKSIKTKNNKWTKYQISLLPSESNDKARLLLTSADASLAAVDMISLFPNDTFHNRTNGLRKDLADTIAALHPKFVRFPGGCMSHGDGIDNIYHWDNTIGELYDRKPDRNIWNYHQTRGLGFYEYFQFCEDIGAEPLPVLAAGVPCQNSAADKNGYGGQQGGIPMSEMPAYCQEILNMIDWANGDPSVSEWAQKRAAAGHPSSFHLKYVGIGNEDIISTVFEERFKMIAKAIKDKFPEIIVCGTVGPFHAPSSDYVEGWKFAKANKSIVNMVDEHYYESTGWFMNHQDYYDNYDRNAPKVYVGEYAADSRPKASNVEAALAEAIYLCNVERNADVVDMASYAPLLSRDKHQNWHPDMIYFNNKEIRTSPSYETQRLFSVYSGDTYVASSLSADSIIRHRVVTSVVVDSKTGRRYLRVVNALPIGLSLAIKGECFDDGRIEYIGFEGRPKSKSIKREKGLYDFSNANPKVYLPAYSVRILIINNLR